MLPKDFPPVSTVRGYFYAWRDAGLWQTINHLLVMSARESIQHCGVFTQPRPFLAARGGHDFHAQAGLRKPQTTRPADEGSIIGKKLHVRLPFSAGLGAATSQMRERPRPQVGHAQKRDRSGGDHH